MGQSIQSGNTTVNGSVTTTIGQISPTVMPDGATLICKTNSGTNADVTIHTVTAGKKLYITAASINIKATYSTGNNLRVQLQADINGDGNYVTLCSATASFANSDFGSESTTIAFPMAIPVPAGKLVKVDASQSGTGASYFASIFGYEVTA